MSARLFLLSPASCTGKRAALLLSPSAAFPLARQLRSPEGAPVGEAFAFISQLYFRGKLAYACAFAATRTERFGGGLGDGVFVITPSRGVVPWHARVGLEDLREFARVEVRHQNPQYATALENTLRVLDERMRREDEVVLLGSVASEKYAAILTKVFGARLLFPREFVGRGDMSRGGLLLRAVRAGRELEYVPLIGSPRHGVRPPRLDPRDR